MPEFDALKYAYPSHRNVVYARRAMACTSVPLGAQIGLDVMKAGGNAMDAAVAMAAAMPLLEPTGNGLGSDCFALIWVEKEKKLYGLNASGVAPKALSADSLKEKGLREMPKAGWLPTMVPGAPAGWAAVNERFGAKPLDELFAPAIAYAREGCPVPVNVDKQWAVDSRRIAAAMAKDPAPHAYWWKSFMKEDGTPYRAGDLFRWEEYAQTLEELAATHCESYYRGPLMEKIVAFSKETGGYFCEEDFKHYHPDWVEPITADYKGYTVCEIPPNGHGISTLMALNILKELDLGPVDSFRSTHLQLEAMKLAFADARRYVADPDYMTVPVERLLSDEYAAQRRACIGDRARLPEPGDPIRGGTVYMCAADGEGNMISYIQSNYMGFGSGVVVPGTGIAMQNRGNNFSMDPASDNCVAPGKRPYHTIIPGFLCKDGKPIGPFGVMGGFMQPQGHLQVVLNTVEYGMNPQAALDHPRWQWVGGNTIEVEQSFPNDLAQALQRAGHDIVVKADPIGFGRGEIIWRNDEGVLCGASEPRSDGQVAVW